MKKRILAVIMAVIALCMLAIPAFADSSPFAFIRNPYSDSHSKISMYTQSYQPYYDLNVTTDDDYTTENVPFVKAGRDAEILFHYIFKTDVFTSAKRICFSLLQPVGVNAHYFVDTENNGKQLRFGRWMAQSKDNTQMKYVFRLIAPEGQHYFVKSVSLRYFCADERAFLYYAINYCLIDNATNKNVSPKNNYETKSGTINLTTEYFNQFPDGTTLGDLSYHFRTSGQSITFSNWMAWNLTESGIAYDFAQTRQRLQLILDSADSDKQELLNKINDMQQRIYDLELAETGLTMARDSFKQERDQALAAQAAAEKERDTAKAKVTELNNKITELNAQITSLNQTITQNEATIKAKEDRIAELQAQIDAGDTGGGASSGEVAQLRAQIQTLQTQIDDLKYQNSNLTSANNALISERDDYRSQADDWRYKYMQALAERNTAEAKAADLQKQLDALNDLGLSDGNLLTVIIDSVGSTTIKGFDAFLSGVEVFGISLKSVLVTVLVIGLIGLIIVVVKKLV